MRNHLNSAWVCFAGVLASLQAVAAAQWTYSGTTLTEVVEDGSGATPWVCSLTAAGALKKTTVGTSTMLDFRSDALPANAPAVVSLADSAFMSCTTLAEIRLPNTVTTLGTSAFQGCSGLTKLVADGVETVSSHAVRECSNLPSASFPKATSLGELAFYSCSKLGDVNIGRCATLGRRTFYFAGITNLVWSGYFDYLAGTLASDPFLNWGSLQARLVCEGTNSASFAYFLSAVQFTPWAVATAADKTAYYNKFGQDAAEPRGIAASESNGLPKTYVVCTEEGPVPGGVEYAYEDDYVICTDASVEHFVVEDRHVYRLTNVAVTATLLLKQKMTLQETLVVGGGGAGAGCAGGGGGGGGVIDTVKSQLLPAGQAFYTRIGKGATGVTGVAGATGESSVLSGPDEPIEAYGGGGSGTYMSPGDAPTSPTLGSGGGAAGGCKASQVSGSGYTAGQGMPGGNGGTKGTSGGGGGAGERGQDGSTTDAHSGRGGEGVTNSITGVAEVYGSGGGAGGGKSNHTSYTTTFAGRGGTNAGTGGDGMKGTNDVWNGTAVSETVGGGWGDGGGQDGVTGFGGGGGGGGVHKLNGTGTTRQKKPGNGGSGTVILSFTVGGTAGQPKLTASDVTIAYPTTSTQPQVAFTMGGDAGAVYSATVTISCGTGALAQAGTAYEDVQVFSGVGNGQAIASLARFYPQSGEKVYVHICVIAEEADPVRVDCETTAQGTVPAFVGHGGDPTRILHVRPDATGKGDGTSWAHAYTSLLEAREAVTAARHEIWYAGDYTLSASDVTYSPSVPVAVRGGFTGTEDRTSDRAPGAKSAMDGLATYTCWQLNLKNDFELDGFAMANGPGVVVTGAGNLTVTNCAFDAGRTMWRGLEATGAANVTLCVADCRFANRRYSGDNGYDGVVSVSSYARAVIDGCTFVSNGLAFGSTANQHDGRWYNGGAALTVRNTPVTVRRSQFRGNVAPVAYDNGRGSGGDNGGIVTLVGNCGGSAFTNCLFVGNVTVCGISEGNADIGYADRMGGALLIRLGARAQTVDVVNCTFAFNTCQACHSAGGLSVGCGTVNLVNSLFAHNRARKFRTASIVARDVFVHADADVAARYCLFDAAEGVGVDDGGSWSLTHGLDADPLLVTTTNQLAVCLNASGTFTGASWPTVIGFNVHLRGRVGYYDEKTGTLCRWRGFASPAIDAGDPASPYANEPEVKGVSSNGRRVNLGAYGNTPYATMTPVRGTFLRVR